MNSGKSAANVVESLADDDDGCAGHVNGKDFEHQRPNQVVLDGLILLFGSFLSTNIDSFPFR